MAQECGFSSTVLRPCSSDQEIGVALVSTYTGQFEEVASHYVLLANTLYHYTPNANLDTTPNDDFPHHIHTTTFPSHFISRLPHANHAQQAKTQAPPQVAPASVNEDLN